MPDKAPSKKSLLRDCTPLWLLIALIAISVPHYENVSGSALLHEISQRLYYLPIIYAAYRYGLFTPTEITTDISQISEGDRKALTFADKLDSWPIS